MASDPPKVLISCSHDSPEHRDRVLVLSKRLRKDGIDCTIDSLSSAPAQEICQYLWYICFNMDNIAL
jgi:hypothetical protein